MSDENTPTMFTPLAAELLSLLDDIDVMEDWELAEKRFEILEKYGCVAKFGPLTSRDLQ